LNPFSSSYDSESGVGLFFSECLYFVYLGPSIFFDGSPRAGAPPEGNFNFDVTQPNSFFSKAVTLYPELSYLMIDISFPAFIVSNSPIIIPFISCYLTIVSPILPPSIFDPRIYFEAIIS